MNEPTLKKVTRLDSIQLDKTYFTGEGYLVDHPIVTSVGIFEYLNSDGSTRRELRLPEEVFSTASLKSYKGKPIIVTHDAGYVNKDNVGEEAIGTILSEGYADGNDVRAEIVIHNADELKNTGLRELSLGYKLTLDETPGVWNGQPYDAIQRDIVINHLALVDKARAGEQARLNIDHKEGRKVESNSNDAVADNVLEGGRKPMIKNRRYDGDEEKEKMVAAIDAFKKRRDERMAAMEEDEEEEIPIVEDAEDEEASAEEEAFEKAEDEEDCDTNMDEDEDPVSFVKDRRCRRDAEGDPEDVESAMGIIAQQDEDIDSLLGIIDAMKESKKAEDEEEEELVTDEDEEMAETEEEAEETEDEETKADRADGYNFRELLKVVRVGDKLRMDGLENMSVKDAKKAVIKKLKPSMRLDGKSVAYINAVYDVAVTEMTEKKSTDTQRKQMMRKDSKPAVSKNSSASEARERMIARSNK